MASVEIVNKSGLAIERLQLKIGSQIRSADNIAPNERANLVVEVSHDASYRFHVLFENGEQVSDSLGYLTNGVNVHDQAIVSVDGITLERMRTEVKKL